MSDDIDRFSHGRAAGWWTRRGQRAGGGAHRKPSLTAPSSPDSGDGDTAALVDFRFLAHAVLPTDYVVGAMRRR
jgi:hypothetical protein